jgi:hypothetical protein
MVRRSSVVTGAIRGALVLALTACAEPATAGSVFVTSGIVYGRVVDEANRPLADAVVRPTFHLDSASCLAGTRDVSGGAVLRTDAAGRYRGDVPSPLGPRSVCVAAEVVRAPSIGWEGSVRVAGRWLRIGYRDWVGVVDSAQVDIQLPAR